MKSKTLFSSAVLFLTLLISNLSYADQTGLTSYSQTKNIFWKQKYNLQTHSLYCFESIGNHRNGFNIEHVFAASWMKRVAGCQNMNRRKCRQESARFNRMEADLHNLFPTVNKINSLRGDLAFGIIPGQANDRCDFEISNGEVEPGPRSRGEIARALLYMEKEYGADLNRDSGSSDLKKLALYWHCTYPVLQDEILRNEAILKIQKNSNPFVDGSVEVSCSNLKSFPED